jgi:fructokinase
MPLYGAVELGGTNTLVAVGTSPTDLSTPQRIPTTDPGATLGSVVEHLNRFQLDSVGIASFGPVELRPYHDSYGVITTTPKPSWAQTPVLETIGDGVEVPVAIDTDVNGSALGEGLWGAGVGLTDFVYITVGTGVGGGAVVRGSTLTGLGHPEMGHVIVTPADGDDYPGRCPYHGVCLEGMASGPALEDRFGPPDSRDAETPARDLAAHYIAQGLRNIVYTLAPQRIIIGGGVSTMNGFHDQTHAELTDQLAGYPPFPEYEQSDFIVPPGLGELSGLAGALVLAQEAL